MNFLNTLPAALYRLAANVFLGAAGAYVLYKVNDIYIVQEVNSFFSGPDLAGWFPAVIMLVVLIFLGEIIALLGEALIHPLFGFPSFKPLNTKDFEIENVTPCAGSGKLTAATMNRTTREQVAFSFSEIHFVLSRILAGTAWLLILGAGGNCALIAIIILLAMLLILAMLCWIFQKIKSLCLNMSVIKILQISNFLLSAALLFCLYALPTDEPGFSSVFILAALFLIINAILYRSFANVCNITENTK